MTVGDLIKKLNKRDKSQTVYYQDRYGKHEITDVSALLTKNGTATIVMNGDGGRYDRKTEQNCSEKPNNSTISKMEQVDKDTNVRSKYDCETCKHWWRSEDVCLLDDCHYESQIDNLKAIRDFQEHFGIEREPTLSEMCKTEPQMGRSE